MSRREYEDYEELGRRLEAFEDALLALQDQVVKMWEMGRGTTEQTRLLAPDAQVLSMVVTTQRLHQDLALQCAAEVEEKDVPEGKPRIPPPFDRRSPFGA